MEEAWFWRHGTKYNFSAISVSWRNILKTWFFLEFFKNNMGYACLNLSICPHTWLYRKKQIISLNILKAHSKTPTEFLYLELGVLPLQWVISLKIITYLKHLEKGQWACKESLFGTTRKSRSRWLCEKCGEWFNKSEYNIQRSHSIQSLKGTIKNHIKKRLQQLGPLKIF